ncbi:MAG: single-stranded DNA-binding protein [Anaerolineaceae bacterium]
MYQKIVVVGRLGRDPEMRFTPSGQAVTSFSVATDNPRTVDGKTVKETVWFRVSAWGKQAENCNNFLSKGKLVLVEGRLTSDSKTGGPRMWASQDGVQHASFEIFATTVKFLSPRTEGAGGAPVEDDLDNAPSEEIPF